MDDLNLDDIEKLSDDALMEMIGNIDFDEEKKNLNNESTDKAICYNCGQDTLVKDYIQGIIVCRSTSCGMVNGSVMDENPEWKNYGDDKGDNSRCSMPINPLLPRSSIGTSIGGSKYGKIQILHSWGMMPYRERSLYIVLKEIQNKCHKNNIFKCIEDDAKIMYKKISECKHHRGVNKGKYIIIRGNNRRSLIAACLFYACKKNDNTRNVKEVAKMFDLKHTDVTKGIKTFRRLMRLRNMDLDLDSNNAEDFIPRYCKLLRIKPKYSDIALQIAKNVGRLNIGSEHTPHSIATACLLMMIHMNDLTITKKCIANKFKVSDVTITKTYNSISSYRDILIDDDKVDTIVEEYKRRKALDSELPANLRKKFDKIKSTFKDNKYEYQGEVFNSPKEDDEEEDDLTDISDDDDKFDDRMMCDMEYDDVEYYSNERDVDLYQILDSTQEQYNSMISYERDDNMILHVTI